MNFKILKILITMRYDLEYERFLVQRDYTLLLNFYHPMDNVYLALLLLKISFQTLVIDIIKGFDVLFRL